MATKHIPDKTWKKVQDLTVKLVIEKREAIKDTEVLNALILKGIRCTKEENDMGILDIK